jgi:transposase
LIEQTDQQAGVRPLERGGMAATVSGSPPDTEISVISQQMWQAVHSSSKAGLTVSGIARALELDRKTVRRCLQQPTWKPYSRSVKATRLLDAHLQWIRDRAPAVNYSARILHQELRQQDFEGSYETVKLAVRPLRAEANLAALTQMRFETAPGEQAQVDWGELSVWMSGQRRGVSVLVMTLGYSRRAYAEGFLNERMPSLLAAHENAFAHFGGCCHSLLYDRMRTVFAGSTKAVDGTISVRLNETFRAFADYWGFEPRLCRAYRPQTKGKVESGVKYLKRNFAPGRSFRDLDDFNLQLMDWLTGVADLRVHGTTHERPIERFEQERAALIRTAGHPSFLQAMPRSRVVASDWLVSVDANRYSVPYALIGKTLQVIREAGELVFRHAGTEVARHAVLAGRYRLSINPEHGPGAAPRNAHRRQSTPANDAGAPLGNLITEAQPVQVRDLRVYEQLINPELAEMTA